MSKGFIGALVAIVVILGGIFFLTQDKASSPGTDDTGNGAVQTSNHTQGEGTDGVTLVEYGDFQCPACASYYPIVKEIKEAYGDRITFQFVHFPLTQIHPNAMAAHRAAEAAGLQGRFWEMHDMIYEQQQAWSLVNNAVSIFEGYAEQLGLDMDKYRADVSSAAVAATINADVRAAQAIGATSTPTFTINGEVVEQNPRNIDEFKALIDDAIAGSGDEQPAAQPASEE